MKHSIPHVSLTPPIHYTVLSMLIMDKAHLQLFSLSDIFICISGATVEH